jgi:glyoxylase-like metal-dependent hydrolase (beta-lactamase superfamily II)
MPNSDYSGHVEPGGPPLRRTVDHAASASEPVGGELRARASASEPVGGERRAVTVAKLSVGSMDNNCYVLADTAAGEALVIDAADEAERILDMIGDLRVVAILTTHGHPDHWQALDEVAGATGAPVLYHGAERARIPVPPDRMVEHGQALTFGAASVTVRHTPGHTDGSVCVILAGPARDRPAITTHLFTGDTLFPGGPGKTQNPDRFRQIMRSLREQLFVLPDDTWVYPGHGDDTTLGDERDQLDHWQARGW